MGREVYRQTHRVVIVDTVPASSNNISHRGLSYRPEGALSPVIDAIVERINAEKVGNHSVSAKGPSIGKRVRLFEPKNGQP